MEQGDSKGYHALELFMTDQLAAVTVSLSSSSTTATISKTLLIGLHPHFREKRHWLTLRLLLYS